MPMTIRPLDEATWDVFAELVERNHGVYGGCWCRAYHPPRPPDLTNQEARRQRVRTDDAHPALVIDGDGPAQVGRSTTGPPNSPG